MVNIISASPFELGNQISAYKANSFIVEYHRICYMLSHVECQLKMFVIYLIAF